VKRVEIITAVVMLALAALVLFESTELPYWAEFAPGSAFAPVWIAGAGALLSITLFVSAVQRSGDEPADLPDRTGIMRVVGTLAGLWFVIVATPYLGLLIAAAMLVLFMLLVVVRRPFLSSLFATAATMALVWGVFVAWLHISLPKGPLGL
jgi:hypothetical protein